MREKPSSVASCVKKSAVVRSEGLRSGGSGRVQELTQNGHVKIATSQGHGGEIYKGYVQQIVQIIQNHSGQQATGSLMGTRKAKRSRPKLYLKPDSVSDIRKILHNSGKTLGLDQAIAGSVPGNLETYLRKNYDVILASGACLRSLITAALAKKEGMNRSTLCRKSNENTLENSRLHLENGLKTGKGEANICHVCNKPGECASQQQDLVECAQCHEHVHTTCLNVSVAETPTQWAVDWPCKKCKPCLVCNHKSKAKSSKVVSCEQCGAAFHKSCISPGQRSTGRSKLFRCKDCFSSDDSPEVSKIKLPSAAAAKAASVKKRYRKGAISRQPSRKRRLPRTKATSSKNALAKTSSHDLQDSLTTYFTPSSSGRLRQQHAVPAMSKVEALPEPLESPGTSGDELLIDLVPDKNEKKPDALPPVVAPEPTPPSVPSKKRRRAPRMTHQKTSSSSAKKSEGPLPPAKRVKVEEHEPSPNREQAVISPGLSPVKSPEFESPVSSPRAAKEAVKKVETIPTGEKVESEESKSQYSPPRLRRSLNKPKVIPDALLSQKARIEVGSAQSVRLAGRGSSTRLRQTLLNKYKTTSRKRPTITPKSSLRRPNKLSLTTPRRRPGLAKGPLSPGKAADTIRKHSAKGKNEHTPVFVSQQDRSLYQKIRKNAGLVLTHDPPDPSIRTPALVEFGKFAITTWYSAPYPQEYARFSLIYICEFCLKYVRSKEVLQRHIQKCEFRYPPGSEIYRKEGLSVFEVDGNVGRIYCQNLCLLAKLFLDHKTLYYDVEPFLFYVLTKKENDAHHFIGYFSKEKYSAQRYNVSCILTLPPYQKQGYGRFLIDFSYLLSKIEGTPGTPEKPLSDLGKISYRSYWKSVVLEYLHDKDGSTISIAEVSKNTGICGKDIVDTLSRMRWITTENSKLQIKIDRSLVVSQYERAKNDPRRIKIDTEAVRWTPVVTGVLASPRETLGGFHLSSPQVIAESDRLDAQRKLSGQHGQVKIRERRWAHGKTRGNSGAQKTAETTKETSSESSIELEDPNTDIRKAGASPTMPTATTPQTSEIEAPQLRGRRVRQQSISATSTNASKVSPKGQSSPGRRSEKKLNLRQKRRKSVSYKDVSSDVEAEADKSSTESESETAKSPCRSNKRPRRHYSTDSTDSEDRDDLASRTSGTRRSLRSRTLASSKTETPASESAQTKTRTRSNSTKKGAVRSYPRKLPRVQARPTLEPRFFPKSHTISDKGPVSQKFTSIKSKLPLLPLGNLKGGPRVQPGPSYEATSTALSSPKAAALSPPMALKASPDAHLTSFRNPVSNILGSDDESSPESTFGVENAEIGKLPLKLFQDEDLMEDMSDFTSEEEGAPGVAKGRTGLPLPPGAIMGQDLDDSDTGHSSLAIPDNSCSELDESDGSPLQLLERGGLLGKRMVKAESLVEQQRKQSSSDLDTDAEIEQLTGSGSKGSAPLSGPGDGGHDNMPVLSPMPPTLTPNDEPLEDANDEEGGDDVITDTEQPSEQVEGEPIKMQTDEKIGMNTGGNENEQEKDDTSCKVKTDNTSVETSARVEGSASPPQLASAVESGNGMEVSDEPPSATLSNQTPSVPPESPQKPPQTVLTVPNVESENTLATPAGSTEILPPHARVTGVGQATPAPHSVPPSAVSEGGGNNLPSVNVVAMEQPQQQPLLPPDSVAQPCPLQEEMKSGPPGPVCAIPTSVQPRVDEILKPSPQYPSQSSVLPTPMNEQAPLGTPDKSTYTTLQQMPSSAPMPINTTSLQQPNAASPNNLSKLREMSESAGTGTNRVMGMQSLVPPTTVPLRSQSSLVGSGGTLGGYSYAPSPAMTVASGTVPTTSAFYNFEQNATGLYSAAAYGAKQGPPAGGFNYWPSYTSAAMNGQLFRAPMGQNPYLAAAAAAPGGFFPNASQNSPVAFPRMLPSSGFPATAFSQPPVNAMNGYFPGGIGVGPPTTMPNAFLQNPAAARPAHPNPNPYYYPYLPQQKLV